MIEIGPLSIFAKILAKENISVTVETVETAMFDLKHRRLILPDWEFKNEEFTKMLIGHEVAHAIYTPLDKWQEYIESKPAKEAGKAKHFVNVVEDCRIDKLIQIRYPGLVSTYAQAANYEVKENFFKLDDTKIGKLSFIDRINVYFKTKFGADGYKINFSAEELPYVKRIEQVEDFDEVLKISEELLQNFNEEIKTKTFEDLENFTGDERSTASGSPSAKKKTPQGRVSVSDKNDDKPIPEDTEVINVPAPGLGCTVDNFLESIQEHGQLNVAKSYEKSMGGTYDIQPIATKDIVLKNWWLTKTNRNLHSTKKFGEAPDQVRVKWRNYINHFAGAFERKKNARNFMRTRQEKTGMLDVGKLHEYLFNDNIFLTKTVEGNNKNHGFIFLIDCSSSMSGIFGHVATQIFVMSEICRKLAIPCRVYGFSDSYTPPKKTANFSDQEISLIEIYSSSNPKATNMRSFQEIHKGNLSLGGTPLGDSLYAMRTLVEEFKKGTGVDVVNFISLTDGGDGTGRSKNYLRDVKTGALIKAGFSTRLTMDNTSAMYRLIRKTTGAKVVHVDITSHPTDGTADFKKNNFCVLDEYGGANHTLFISPTILEPKNRKLIELFADALK